MSLKLLPDPPLSFTFGTFQSYLLADLTSFEEPLLESTISVLVCGGGTLFSIVQEGFSASAAEDRDKRRGGSEKVAKVCIEEATSRRKEIWKLLRI
jgi:hypothetical protein